MSTQLLPRSTFIICLLSRYNIDVFEMCFNDVEKVADGDRQIESLLRGEVNPFLHVWSVMQQGWPGIVIPLIIISPCQGIKQSLAEEAKCPAMNY